MTLVYAIITIFLIVLGATLAMIAVMGPQKTIEIHFDEKLTEWHNKWMSEQARNRPPAGEPPSL